MNNMLQLLDDDENDELCVKYDNVLVATVNYSVLRVYILRMATGYIRTNRQRVRHAPLDTNNAVISKHKNTS